MLTNGVRAVVFDIGDTLIDASGIEQASLARTVDQLVRVHLAEPDCPLLHCYRSAVACRISSPHLNRLFGLPYQLFVEACARAHLSSQATFVGFALYQSFVREQITVDPELVGLFRSLRALGIGVGIASDGTTPEQLDTLHRLGVLSFVSAMAVSDVVGELKPHPAMFAAVLAELGVRPDEAAYVGDSWERDVVGARRVGMIPVHVVREANTACVDRDVPAVRLGRLQDLLRLLSTSVVAPRGAAPPGDWGSGLAAP